jgi:hypothetical protein
MKRYFLPVFVAAASLLAPAARSERAETVEQMKARAESARPEDRILLCADIAAKQLVAARAAYTDGNGDAGKDLVLDVVLYSEKAAESATQVHKKEKQLEIRLREMAKRLEDLRRSLTFEDQPPVKAAADRLESLRTKLLKDMFKKD